MHSPVPERLDRCLHRRSYVCSYFLLGLRIRPNFLDRLLVGRCNLGLLALTLALDGCSSEFTLLLISRVLLYHILLPSIMLLGLCQSFYLNMFVDGLAKSAKIRFEVVDGSEDPLPRSVVRLGLLLAFGLVRLAILWFRLTLGLYASAMESRSMRHNSMKGSLERLCLVRY
jgi:hypothetical protein